MSVDNATQSYRIIAMETYTRSRREGIHLYDSTTTKWRKLCEVPGDEYLAYSIIFLKGVMYTLFVDAALVPWCPKLYSCDLETGEWSYINVALPQPSYPQEKSQLVVSLGRLFFVEYTEIPRYPIDNHVTAWESLLDSIGAKKKQLIKVRIWEILLGEKELVKVAELPEFSKYPRRMLKIVWGTGDTMVVLGRGNSLVILSVVGGCVEFDLLKRCWHELPTISEHIIGTCRRGIYGGLVRLDLRTMST